MNKTTHTIWKTLKLSLGIFLMIISIGGFASGDTILAILVLLAGILLIPRKKSTFYKWVNKISKTQLKMRMREEEKKFIQNLDLRKDIHLIQIIDKELEKTHILLDKKKLGKKIYQKVLEINLNNHSFSKEEKQKLRAISTYFDFSKKEEIEIKKNYLSKAQEVIKSLMLPCFQKEPFDKKGLEEILDWSNYLNISEDIYLKLKKESLLSVFERKANKILLTNRLSPEDEQALAQMITQADFSKDTFLDFLPETLFDQLISGKLLWGAERGIFYPLPNENLTLQKDEKCHWVIRADSLESEIETTGVSYSGGLLSVPLLDNVRVGAGGGNGNLIKEKVERTYSGILALTNKRIIFTTSDNKSFQVPFNELLTYKGYIDGLELVVSQKNYLLKCEGKDAALFVAGIEGTIRNRKNKKNEELKKAKMTIQNNEILIDIEELIRNI